MGVILHSIGISQNGIDVLTKCAAYPVANGKQKCEDLILNIKGISGLNPDAYIFVKECTWIIPNP